MRKALCVGIDSYNNMPFLTGCVNDANSVKAALERNGDGTRNFEVKLMTATSESRVITRGMLRSAIEELFNGDPQIALFYYAGHGSIDEIGGYLCTSEVERAEDGISLNDLMLLASKSKAKNKVIILDSCFSGDVSNVGQMQGYSVINEGTTILAACGKEEYASEENGQGVFTSLLIEALYGGAMNLLGEVSPGSVYAYVDQSLGAWEQRPIFKANIKSFVCLRKNVPLIDLSELRMITEFFKSPAEEFKLDPTYEPCKNEVEDKTIDKDHEAIFSILQKYVKLNLVIPVGEEHMYYAAIRSKSCKLTAVGQHYWKLVNKDMI